MIERIFICVVLPISIVLITSVKKILSDNKRSQVIVKAIEADKEIDTDKLLDALQKPKKSAQEILNSRLLYGCIYSLVGLSLIVSGIVSSVWYADSDTMVLYIFESISIALGISYLIVYFLTRKQVCTNQPDKQ